MKPSIINSDLIKGHYGIEFNDDQYKHAFIKLTDVLYEKRIQKIIMTPEDVILEWEDFVSELQNGYFDIPPEFDNDLDIVRTNIDTIIESDKLRLFEDHKLFCIVIGKIDEKFIELTNEVNFLPEDWKWWKRRFLKKAGKEYAEFINDHWKDQYGLIVDIIE